MERYQQLVQWLYQLTEPSPKTIDPEDRFKQRLLNMLLLVFAPMSIILSILDNLRPPLGFLWQQPDKFAVLIALVIFFYIIYFLSRRGQYKTIMPMLMVVGFGVIFVNSFATTPPHTEIMYLGIMVSFASNIYRPIVTIVMGCVALALLTLFTILADGMTADLYGDLRIFLIVITIFSLFITYHRDQLEQDRQNIILAEQTRLKLILDNLPIFVWTMTDQLKIASLNGTADSALESELRTYLASDDALTIHRNTQSNTQKRAEIELDERPFEVIIQKSTTTNPMAYVGAAIDIHDRKENEQFVREQVRREEQQRVLDDFLTSASHDLRTPLSVMRTSTYLIERAEDNDTKQRHINKLNHSIDHLERTINSMFQLLRLNGMPTSTATLVDVNQLLHNAMTNNEEYATTRDITLITDFEENMPQIFGIQNEIITSFSEIIKNAVQFSPSHETVIIRTCTTESSIRIDIIDQGIGINEENQRFIFDPFFRVAKDRSLNQQQIGVGLTIAKRIIDRNGGRITVDSTVAQGTTISITFPIII